jgi:hypothetical protein
MEWGTLYELTKYPGVLFVTRDKADEAIAALEAELAAIKERAKSLPWAGADTSGKDIYVNGWRAALRRVLWGDGEEDTGVTNLRVYDRALSKEEIEEKGDD